MVSWFVNSRICGASQVISAKSSRAFSPPDRFAILVSARCWLNPNHPTVQLFVASSGRFRLTNYGVVHIFIGLVLGEITSPSRAVTVPKIVGKRPASSQ